jgi:hypothetical protein
MMRLRGGTSSSRKRRLKKEITSKGRKKGIGISSPIYPPLLER